MKLFPRRHLKPLNPGLASLVLVFLLVGCSQLATVKTVAPENPAALIANQQNNKLTQARENLESAEDLSISDPKAAMALNESAALLSLEALESLSGKKGEAAIALYNYAIARLVETTLVSGQKPWEKEIQLNGPDGTYFLKLSAKSKDAYIPGEDRLLAADRMKIGGVFFPDRTRIDGVGAPFVSAGKGRSEPWAPDKHHYGVTIVLTFSGRHGTLHVLDPNQTTKVWLAGKNRVVAADLTAPVALTMTEVKPESFGIKGLFRTDKYLSDAKLIMVEPYRGDRIPLIFVHGLSSSPATWVPIFNALNADPKIRKKYQFWVFRYPTGLPFPISAELLRTAINSVYDKYPGTPKAVLVGHSMGGLLCDMLIRNSGTQYATDVLGKPIDQLDMPPEDIKEIRGALEFKVNRHVDKVIFMATPHRGANMASGIFGRIIAGLVRLPLNMVKLGPKLISKMSLNKGEQVIDRFPNSIDTLRPTARIVVALNKLPISQSIPYYSIIGNSGDKELLKSSDGIVPYSSSHLDGARSELVVPAARSAVLRNLEAIQDVQRILLQP